MSLFEAIVHDAALLWLDVILFLFLLGVERVCV